MKTYEEFDLALKIEEIDMQLTNIQDMQNIQDMEDIFIDDLLLVEPD